MRHLLFYLLIFIPFMGLGQIPTITKATSQGWAGGACCVSGTNYSVTISGSEEILKTFKVKSVCIGGHSFDSTMITVSAYTRDHIKYITLGMGIVNNQHDRHQNIETKTIACENQEVNFSGCKSEYTLKIEKVEDLFLIAYP